MSLVGQRLGHYRVLRLLGRGGMGEVYVGFDETLERKVALKVILAEKRLGASAKARFLREARVLSQLDHPGICRIHNYVEGQEQDFLVLELIEGESLNQAILSGLDRSRAMAIAEQIAEVLVAAHAAGVVHRDLKPENVMLTVAGECKVLDFGLARTVREPADRPAPDDVASNAPAVPDPVTAVDLTCTSAPARLTLLTEAGSISGTPMYMSPEQASGEVVSASSDMYSFGLLLQAMFTGQTPYEPTPELAALMQKVRRAETRPVTGLDPHLTELIKRLESLAPGARPTSSETAARLRWIRGKARRRLKYMALAAGISLVVLAALKYTLDLRRARDIAEQRRGQAEDLLEFVLGDLRRKLEPVGRLDVLDDVGQKAMRYFASVPENELSEQELFRRSQALAQIGEVRSLRGNLAGAFEAFQESLGLAEEMVQRDPANTEWQTGLGTSHFWVGFVAWRKGDLDAALREFEQYRRVAAELVSTHPDDSKLRLELGYAHSNLGSVLEAKGTLEEALVHYRACLEIEGKLAEGDPGNRDLQLDLANSYNAVGNILADLGDPSGAMASYLADLGIKQRLVALDPANATWRFHLSVVHNLIGNLQLGTGDPEAGLEHLREATASMEDLARSDPENARWQRELALDHSALGSILTALARNDAASSSLARAAETLSRLSANDPTDASLKWEAANTLTRFSRTLESAGRLDEAEQKTNLAAALVDDLLEQDGRDPHNLWLDSAVHEVLGRVWSKRGQPGRAREAWSEALESVEPAARSSADRRMLEQWGRVLLLLDRPEEARPVVERVTRMGYRDAELLALCARKGLVLLPGT